MIHDNSIPSEIMLYLYCTGQAQGKLSTTSKILAYQLDKRMKLRALLKLESDKTLNKRTYLRQFVFNIPHYQRCKKDSSGGKCERQKTQRTPTKATPQPHAGELYNVVYPQLIEAKR